MIGQLNKVKVGLIENLKSYTQDFPLSSGKKELFNSFLSKGFPTLKDEEWKYTSLKKIVSENYTVEKVAGEISKKIIEKYSLGFKNKVVFSDGKLISTPKMKGITFSDFSDFECSDSDSILKLNSALANNGFTIKVDNNTIADGIIEILFFTTTENSFNQYRNQIIIGDNAEVKFVEKIQNLSNSTSFVNNFTQIKCGENTNIEYNKIQNNTENSKLIDTMNIFQQEDSTCNVNTLIFGGSFTRNNLNFEQNGCNCESHMNGVSILDDNQLADNHTFVDHKKAHCKSNEMYKGIYLGNSKGIFNGKIMVRQDSQKIDAFQANNNLLLSDNATIDSKPQLEIYADDVKCSHGCTIGQLDDDALFYMRSRGIVAKEAKALLTYTFASEAIENISIPEVKIVAQKLLAKKLDVDLEFKL